MNNPTDCKNRRQVITALVLGELEPQAADELKRHIDTCKTCESFYQAIIDEEETIRSTFETIAEKGETIQDILVKQFSKCKSTAYQTDVVTRKTIKGIFSTVMKSKMTKLTAAALIIIAVLIGVHQFARSFETVAWADVVERFQSVPFFSAAIYIKEDVTSEPEQMELWMSRAGKARMRIGTQVIFGNHGKIVRAFDIKTRAQTEADERAALFLKRIGEADEFSLDSIIRFMFRGTMQDVTPLINPDAVISQDMVVFDVELPRTPEWVRIWALRESQLPVRIRIWDPRDGDATDAVFEYSKEQADEFFDPNAFENLLRTGRTSSRVNLTYAFLKDPGGKRITPEDMFAQVGYHVPQVQQVGITPDGAVWIIAAKGRNRTPSGHNFYGFEKIQDDLGREYRRVYSSHLTSTDQSMQVFVPMDYPFDEQIPEKLTLICQVDDYHPRIKQELIGTEELTQWQHKKIWPEGTITDNEQSFRNQMAWRHCNGERYEKAERIMDTIEGELEDNPAALERERIRLRMLLKQEKTDEALALSERLMPLLLKDYKKWTGCAPDAYIFADLILAQAYAGKFDQVKQTWQQIKNAQPELHPKLTQSARKHIEEDIQRGLDICLRRIVPQISRTAHLTIKQLNTIFDIDIKKSDQFRHFTFWDWNPEFEKPKYRNWERHLEELAEYYKSHPLPEKMEIIKRNTEEEYGITSLKMPGIEGYWVYPLSGNLRDEARHYRYPDSVGRVRVEADISDTKLNHDLVIKSGVADEARQFYTLNFFGLEVVEVNEPRTVWIAKHDGRKLKDFKEVRAPVPYPGSDRRKAGMMTSMSSGGFDLDYLFRDFMDWQNILIVDETGIKDRVSHEGPCWEGPEAPEIARKWFADEFGITFTEQTREMKTYVIRKRQ